MTRCTCGNVKDPGHPEGFTITYKPCTCTSPAPFVDRRCGAVIMRGDHPRDPARARLGLPDRTPLEKAILRGRFSE